MAISEALRRLRAVAAVAATSALMVGAALPAGAATVGTPLVGGLVAPLGLAIGNDGTVYVVEAFAGRITTVDKKGRRDVLLQTEEGLAGIDAGGKGQTVFTTTVFPEDGAPANTTLSRVTPQGKTRTLASLQAYEEAHNPDRGNEYGFVGAPADCLAQLPPFLQPYSGIVESNPYAVAIVPGGYLVADAAANAILKVARNGRVTTVAVLPPIPQVIDEAAAAALSEMIGEAIDDPDYQVPGCVVGRTYFAEAVPTDVEVGPDGHYYVSTLPGFPELPGAGSVWRINSRTGAVERVASGFTGAVDLAVGRDGVIYVAELFGGRISAFRNGVVSTLVELQTPGAVEIGRDGRLYATTGVFPPGNGAVVVITP
ncbi:MAG TPA: ScyD/ScyE family protein [Egibacteraceae bacterium]|nr:ScyD/ScyE family protein [Egibacteraceae bacterium]